LFLASFVFLAKPTFISYEKAHKGALSGRITLENHFSLSSDLFLSKTRLFDVIAFMSYQ